MSNAERQARFRALRNAQHAALAEENAQLKRENARLRAELGTLRNAAPPRSAAPDPAPLRNATTTDTAQTPPASDKAASDASKQALHNAHDDAPDDDLELTDEEKRRLKQITSNVKDPATRRARAERDLVAMRAHLRLQVSLPVRASPRTVADGLGMAFAAGARSAWTTQMWINQARQEVERRQDELRLIELWIAAGAPALVIPKRPQSPRQSPRQKRLKELKSIVQREHPDKRGDVEKFRKARAEYEHLTGRKLRLERARRRKGTR